MCTKRLSGVALLGSLVGLAFVLAGCPEGIDLSNLDPVYFKDSALEAAVRDQLGNPLGILTKGDVLQLRGLDARGLGIRNLAGIENCTNLTWLDIDTNEISDLSPLANLLNITTLNADSNEIFDLAPLVGLINLDALSLFDNQVSDIQPLVTNAVNGGLGPGDYVNLDERHLSERAVQIDIPILETNHGVNVVVVVPASS